MSAHVLLNLFNELGKRKPIILSLIRNEFNLSFFFLSFFLLYVPCQQLWSLRDGQFT